MNRPCIVYGLLDSHDGEIRYVGQTGMSLDRRLIAHMSESRRQSGSNHKCRWIRSVVRQGREVRIVPLVVGAEWNATEIEVIARMRAQGARLVNATAGGEGVPELSPEVRAKVRAACVKFYSSPEVRAQVSARTRKAMSRPDVAERVRKNARARWANPVNRSEQADRVRNRFSCADERAKQAERTGKLTVEQVREARNLRDGGAPLADLCARFGIAMGPMSMLCRRITYRHVA